MEYMQLNGTPVQKSSHVVNLLHDYMADLDHEEMWILFLAMNNSPIACEMLTKGSLTYTPIDARMIVKRSLLNNAAGIIIIHNHVSGNPKPSRKDLDATEKVRQACRLFDIDLTDHIIISRDSFFSFADSVTTKIVKA
ncbi:MAG: JAB domain-containing protein [Bacteroidales bacterium]|nr:JAB domain-containing protein [Bacteroidales bacterium]